MDHKCAGTPEPGSLSNSSKRRSKITGTTQTADLYSCSRRTPVGFSVLARADRSAGRREHDQAIRITLDISKEPANEAGVQAANEAKEDCLSGLFGGWVAKCESNELFRQGPRVFRKVSFRITMVYMNDMVQARSYSHTARPSVVIRLRALGTIDRLSSRHSS
jgi:hypothetical protein